MSALPGLGRVAAATGAETTVSSFLGYGYHGPVLADDDVHHRAFAGASLGLAVQPWLALSLRADGRYDRHTAVPNGSDDGWVGEPRMAARVRGDVTEALAIGAHLGVWIPGRSAPSLVLEATSIDLLGIATFAPRNARFAITANAGFRLDQSAASADDADRLSLADRMSLGVSDSHAALVGVGGSYRLERIELFGEWTWDLFVGDDAPRARESPMRLSAGARIAASRSWYGQLVADVGLSADPEVAVDAPLVPVEPRFAVTAGIGYRFAGAAPEATQRLEVAPQPDVPPRPSSAIAGTARSANGIELPGARITVEAGNATRETTADDRGRFHVDELPAGPATLRVEAEGHVTRVLTVTLEPGQTTRAEGALEPHLPEGQLRGLVRSFEGKPLADAALSIQPGDRQVQTDATGWFEIELAPGTYEVSVQASGFREQTRTVTIEEDGVTIHNFDLRAGP